MLFGISGYNNQYGASVTENYSRSNQNTDRTGKQETSVRVSEPGSLQEPTDGKVILKDASGNPVKGSEEDGSARECQTCKNRKYKDGSDEMVSFKSPSHLSPQAAPAAVRSHEQEHVTNAYSEASQNNGKVLSATVSIHMAVCPECGRSYVSGGTTHTQIKYYNEENPYQQDLKSADRTRLAGMNLDYAL